MGLPLHEAKEMRINQFCKVISEFALEYRTTRDKVLHMLEKKANQRERKKTRGKMIHEVSARSQRRINFRMGIVRQVHSPPPPFHLFLSTSCDNDQTFQAVSFRD